MDIRNSQGEAIRDWRDWTRPKDATKHWRAGRSALELARAWFTSEAPRIPAEVAQLLATSSLLDHLVIENGSPEAVTPLPHGREGRNHDLLLTGTAACGKVVVAVEAKADEPFGSERIGSYWRRMRDGRDPRDGSRPTPSNLPERIEALLQILLGNVRPDRPPWSEVRYQLLTAAAGAVVEAERRKAQLAVLIIHEFRTTETRLSALEKNAADLHRFLDALGLDPASYDGPQLLGPHQPPRDHPPLLIGKAVTDWSRG